MGGNQIFIYNTLLCVVMLFLNLKKIGLKGKTIFVPSTFFWGIWLLSSFGCYLFSSGLVDSKDYFKYSPQISMVGIYQFYILVACAIGFLLARLTTRHYIVGNSNTSRMRLVGHYYAIKLRWVLYLFFIIGIIKLIIVVDHTGFNYANIRNYYLLTRGSWSTFEIELQKLGSYVLQVTLFYVALLGFDAALNGLRVGYVIKTFLIFCPFQVSQGGRLFILSFFLPFLIGYLVAYSIFPKNNKKDLKKLLMLGMVPIFLVVFIQSLKLGVDISNDGIGSQFSEIFYSTAIYKVLTEMFKYIDFTNLPLGYGRNSLYFIFGHSPEYTEMWQYWIDSNNSAAVCVPSMLVDLLFDFGFIGSFIVAIVIFYIIEYYALKSLSSLTIKDFLLYIFLCITCFNLGTAGMGDTIKSLIVTVVLSYFISKYLNKQIGVRI